MGTGTPRAEEILRVWDEGSGLPMPERALVLASLADPGSPSELAERPLGCVTGLLLRLRRDLVGPSIDAVAECSGCGMTVEFALDAAELLNLADKIADEQPPLVFGAYALDWRCPSTADLLAVADLDNDKASPALLRRCVRDVRHEGGPARLDDLPADGLAALLNAIAEADPLAEIAIELVCPDCTARFATSIDVPAFVWAEVESRAQRLLVEVDALARCYGWTQQDVLALSETRRAQYLRLIGDGAL